MNTDMPHKIYTRPCQHTTENSILLPSKVVESGSLKREVVNDFATFCNWMGDIEYCRQKTFSPCCCRSPGINGIANPSKFCWEKERVGGESEQKPEGVEVE